MKRAFGIIEILIVVVIICAIYFMGNKKNPVEEYAQSVKQTQTTKEYVNVELENLQKQIDKSRELNTRMPEDY